MSGLLARRVLDKQCLNKRNGQGREEYYVIVFFNFTRISIESDQ